MNKEIKIEIWRAFHAMWKMADQEWRHLARRTEEAEKNWIFHGDKWRHTLWQNFRAQTTEALNMKLDIEAKGREYGHANGYGAIYPEMDIDEILKIKKGE